MAADADLLPDPLGPTEPPSWRRRAQEWSESLDMSPSRLVLGAVVLGVLGLAAWKLLAPAPVPPEMALPMASAAEGAPPQGSAGGEASGPAAPSGGEAGPGVGEAGDPEAGADAETEVVVHVAGAVEEPGVRRLPAAARLVDAVEAAGGATAEADLARVNLAAEVEDGQQVYVPRTGEEVPAAAAAPPGMAGGEGDGETEVAPVDVNGAGAEQLQDLPGIGPTISQAIVDHREEHGPFTSVEQLMDVRGIGEAKLDALRDLVVL